MVKKKDEFETVETNSIVDASSIISDILGADKDIEGICANEMEIADPTKMVSTGLIPLDMAFGGGIMKGRVYEVSGPESHGKSTLVDTVVANWMKANPKAICLRIESESTMDKIRCQMIGIDLKRMIVCEDVVIQEVGYEQIAKVQNTVHEKYGDEVPLLIVWDTLTAAAPRVEIESDNANGSGMMKNARVNSQEMRKLNNRCARFNHSAIIIQQVREDGVDMYGNTKYKTTGGQALKHYFSSRVGVKRRAPIFKDDLKTNPIIGYEVELQMLKNKLTGEAKPVPVVMNLIEGFDPYQSAAIFALEKNAEPFITIGGGGWFYVTDHRGNPEYLKIRGSKEFAKQIRENPYLYKLIEYSAYYNKASEHELYQRKFENMIKHLYSQLEELYVDKNAPKLNETEEKELNNKLDNVLDNLNI